MNKCEVEVIEKLRRNILEFYIPINGVESAKIIELKNSSVERVFELLPLHCEYALQEYNKGGGR
jgi:hypothetical protein